jgi:hypothetical protein
MEEDDIRRYYERMGKHYFPYHFYQERIEQDVVVIAATPLNGVVAHCRGHNSTLIGYCFGGDFNLLVPSDETLALAAKHIRALMEQFSFGALDVYPHNHFCDTTCPGKLFDFDRLMRLLV